MRYILDERPSAFDCDTTFRIWLEKFARAGKVLLSAGAPGMEDHETFGSDGAALSRAQELAREWDVRWCDKCRSWHARKGHWTEHAFKGALAPVARARPLDDTPPMPAYTMQADARRKRPRRCRCGRVQLGDRHGVPGHTLDGCDV